MINLNLNNVCFLNLTLTFKMYILDNINIFIIGANTSEIQNLHFYILQQHTFR